MYKLALQHHGKASAALEIGLRICLTAEAHFGHLLNPALVVQVNGSRELGDVIQGITRARLANPPRFTFYEAGTDDVTFSKDGKALKFCVLPQAPQLPSRTWQRRSQILQTMFIFIFSYLF